MHPGRLRFVRVPPSNSLRELVVRIADGCGIESSYGASVDRLKAKIRHVLKHTGIVLIFDEGAWLLPRRGSNTEAHRLNWLRDELYDSGLPTVIGVTPQWWDEDVAAFVKRTRYVMAQFTGRCERLELPQISRDDVLKVVEAHFPEIEKKAEKIFIGSYAYAAENFLQAIGDIEKRARYTAKKAGKDLSIQVVREVIGKMFPKAVPASTRNAAADVSEDFQAPVKQDLKPAYRDGGEVLLTDRFMRRSGSEKDEAELLADS
jgi:hypothetical protein